MSLAHFKDSSVECTALRQSERRNELSHDFGARAMQSDGETSALVFVFLFLFSVPLLLLSEPIVFVFVLLLHKVTI